MPETQLTAEPPTQTDGHGSSGSRLIRGVLITALGGTLWGLNGTLSKYVMETYAVDPLWFACVREFFACWLFLAAAAIPIADTSHRHSPAHVPFSHLRHGNWCHFALAGLLPRSIKWTNSGTATVLQALSMPLVLIFVCIKGGDSLGAETRGLVLAATAPILSRPVATPQILPCLSRIYLGHALRSSSYGTDHLPGSSHATLG